MKNEEKNKKTKALIPTAEPSGKDVSKETAFTVQEVIGEHVSVFWKSNYISPDVQKVFDIKKERLRQWIKLGYIKPSVKASSGPGTHNVFSTSDLFNIGLFKKLTDVGFNRWIASRFAQEFKEEDWKKVNHGKLKYMTVVGNIDRRKNWRETMRLSKTKSLPSKIKDIEFVLIMNLGELLKNIDDKVLKINLEKE